MKYLFVILFSVASSLAHASYHGGEGSTEVMTVADMEAVAQPQQHY